MLMFLKPLAIVAIVVVIANTPVPVRAQEGKVAAGQIHTSKISYCIHYDDAKRVWEAHKQGSFADGGRAFAKLARQAEKGSPKCRRTQKAVPFTIVKIFDEATLYWGKIGDRPSYFMAIRFKGGEMDRFAVGFILEPGQLM